MISFIKKMFVKYREILLYLIFGGLTTLLSIAAFELFFNVFKISANTIPSRIISNAVGIAFAYFTNRKWVFESRAKGFKEVFKELTKFVGARLFTVLFDIAFVYVAVNVLLGNATLWGIVSNVVVVILNYFISKLLVFVKQTDKKKLSDKNTDNSNVDTDNADENTDNSNVNSYNADTDTDADKSVEK